MTTCHLINFLVLIVVENYGAIYKVFLYFNRRGYRKTVVIFNGRTSLHVAYPMGPLSFEVSRFTTAASFFQGPDLGSVSLMKTPRK